MFKEVNPNPLKGMLAIKLALLSLFLLLAGCGGGGGGGAALRTLTSIAITPATFNVPLGTTVQLQVMGTYSDNAVEPIASTQVTWGSAPANLVTIDSDGTVVGVTQGGPVTITATLLTVQATATVNVTAPALVGLDITPATTSLPKGGLTVQFTATGRLSDGTDEDYTNSVTWGSAEPGFATIDIATGLATTMATAGTAPITAVNGDVKGSASLVVTNPTLNTVAISPSSPTLGLGTTQQLTATAFYGDGSVYDVTELATWSPTAGANVSVNNTAGSKGIITGVTAGLSDTIFALFDTETGSTLATVSSAVLSSIEVQPANRNISNGSQLAFTAIGHYNDGTIQDFTDQVSWISSDDAIVSIGLSTGVATAESVGGPITISATGFAETGTTTLAVKNTTLKGINVTSPEAILALGTQTTLTALGNYSDGDTQDLSSHVTWVSTDSTILTVNASGRVTAVGAGTARISALSSVASGSVISSVGITVTNDALLSIAIDVPDDTSMAAGTRQSLKVTGTFAAHIQDMTDQVVWSWITLNTGQVSISNDLGTAGELTALALGAPGDVRVTASYPGVALVTRDIEINNGSITGLTLSLSPATATVDIGEVRQLTAMASYNAGAGPQDVTDQVAWSSGTGGDDAVVSVSNFKGTEGQVTGIEDGATATIFANIDGLGFQSQSITVSVVDNPIAPVSLTVEAAPNVILAGPGGDDTELTINVLPKDVLSTDLGTTVTLTVESGPGVLSASSVDTAGWVATGVTLTAATTGMTVVKASVTTTNGTISNTVQIDAVNDFADLIGKAATFAGNDDGAGNLQIGAFFGLFATNLSNREFNVTAFLFTDSNGDTTGTAEPAQLSGGILEAGEQMGFVVQTGDVFPLGIFEAAYGFSDAGTSETFNIGAQYDATTIP